MAIEINARLGTVTVDRGVPGTITITRGTETFLRESQQRLLPDIG